MSLNQMKPIYEVFWTLLINKIKSVSVSPVLTIHSSQNEVKVVFVSLHYSGCVKLLKAWVPSDHFLRNNSGSRNKKTPNGRSEAV